MKVYLALVGLWLCIFEYRRANVHDNQWLFSSLQFSVVRKEASVAALPFVHQLPNVKCAPGVPTLTNR